MKFVDLANIYLKSGDGGDGHVSFRKEKFVPKGGPDGGNGGKGGDVIIKVDPHLNTLLDFQYKRHFLAKNGQHGGKSRKSGKDAPDTYIKVPVGTVVKNSYGDIIADLSERDQEYIIAKGGNGGYGNAEFATATNQAPRFAKPGFPGIEMDVTLELKLLADVGIVGFPNVGKSTFISVVSAAKPKIADYHFTTLIPNLGIVKIAEQKSFVIADIPGLIEGAADGKGLGIQFLRHVERCRILLFMLDSTDSDPLIKYQILRNELDKYNPEMSFKKRIICFNKIDAIDSDRLKEIKKIKFKEKNTKIFYISAATHLNTDELKMQLWHLFSEDNEII